MAALPNVSPSPQTHYFLVTFGMFLADGELFRLGLFQADLISWPRLEIRLVFGSGNVRRADAKRITKAEFDMYHLLHGYPILKPYDQFRHLTYEVFRVNAAQVWDENGPKCYT